MNKNLLKTTICALCCLSLCSTLGAQEAQRPKLVVGIVVDQMRWDYLYRFSDRFADGGGLRRLLSDGFSCENTMIEHLPSYTAIGHAGVYTGSVPSLHGIAGNNFVHQATGRWIYCTEDTDVQSVGTTNPQEKAGKMSPRNLQVTTVTDELKLATNFRSKVLGVAMKDRGSILPAGHAADAAYWFEEKTGKWITSTWYRPDLPEWLASLNAKNLPEKYLKQDWTPLYPIETYIQSTSEGNQYEEKFETDKEPLFPIQTSQMMKKQGVGIIRATPYGNTLTLEVAREAIENEALGADNVCDFLTISLSSPDYIGHQFGPNSAKIEDCYLRLDKDLGEFFAFLDKKIGHENYLVFLTADHAGAHNGAFLRDHKIAAGNWNEREYRDSLNQFLKEKFGIDHLVRTLNNYQVNYDYAKTATTDFEKVKTATIDYLQHFDNIQYAVDMKKAALAPIPQAIKEKIINGYNHALSGEVQIILKAGWYSDSDLRGATHGSWNPYDTHIPLLFYGWKVPRGKTASQVSMNDIAPTIAALLHIQMPSGCIGKPIIEVVKQQ